MTGLQPSVGREQLGYAQMSDREQFAVVDALREAMLRR